MASSCSCRRGGMSCVYVELEPTPKRRAHVLVQVAVSERASKFKMAEISIVEGLLKGHAAAQQSKFPSGNERRMVKAAELEREQYNLMISMISHDLRSYDQWTLRCADRESARYHHDLQLRQQKQVEALKAAKNYLTESSRDWMMSLRVITTPTDGMASINELLQRIAQLLGYVQPNAFICLCPLCLLLCIRQRKDHADSS